MQQQNSYRDQHAKLLPPLRPQQVDWQSIPESKRCQATYYEPGSYILEA